MACKVTNSALKGAYDSTVKAFNDIKGDLRSNFFKTALKVAACISALFIFSEIFVATGAAALLSGALGVVGGSMVGGIAEGLAMVLSFYGSIISLETGKENFDKIRSVFYRTVSNLDSRFNYSINASVGAPWPTLNIDSFEKVQERYNSKTFILERALRRII